MDEIRTEGNPRAYTQDEVLQALMQKFRNLAKYWAEVDLGKHVFNSPQEELEYRCNGVAFSMLSTLDGSSMELPAFDLVARPHESDCIYCQKIGKNWFEKGMCLSNNLHEKYSEKTS